MRIARVLLFAVLLVPLGLLAGRFCSIDVVDPVYHGLLWLHEHLLILVVTFGAVSAATAILRFARISEQLRALEMLSSETPTAVARAFARVTYQRRPAAVVYVDVPAVFCFAVFGRRVMISRGFTELLDDDELRLVAEHEVLHAERGDPLRALLWHLFFAALVVPGFDRLEAILYARRERAVDLRARSLDPPGYDALIERFDTTMCGRAPVAAFRTSGLQAVQVVQALVPAAAPLAFLAMLLTSQILFTSNLSYLLAHHC